MPYAVFLKAVLHMSDLQLRLATSDDLNALLQLEHRCFTEDRLSRRSFRRFLDMPRDRLIVAETENEGEKELLGYCLVLMSAATRMARIYSIAVLPTARGRGIGEELVRTAEHEAADAGRILMRLEVREDNSGAIGLYKRLGYRQFGTYRDYYEDHGTALRFERRILFYEPSTRIHPGALLPSNHRLLLWPSGTDHGHGST